MTVPAHWRIVEQSIGAVDAILLGDTLDDDHRVSVTIVGQGDDAPEADATIVYPCAACGWAMTCQDCHA